MSQRGNVMPSPCIRTPTLSHTRRLISRAFIACVLLVGLSAQAQAQNDPPIIVDVFFFGAFTDHSENDEGLAFDFEVDVQDDKFIFADGLILSGADGGKFNGMVTAPGLFASHSVNVFFNDAPDFEAPTDVGGTAGDNIYRLTLSVRDSGGAESDPFNLTVTVTNVNEEGTISAITGTPQVGETLTAGTVETDPDAVTETNLNGAVSVTPTYQWESAPDGTTAADRAWADISGATSETYAPVVDDVTRIIRVVASYTGVPGYAAHTATSAPTDAVQPQLAFSAGPDLTSSNSGDYAMEGDTLTLTFTVNLDLASDPSVTIAGQSLTATAPDSDNVYTAAYTVNAAQVMDMDGALAMYATAEMAADGNPDNTLAPTTAESAIRIDLTAPVITRTGDAAITLTVGTDYTDEGATATDTVDDNVSVTTGGDAVNTNTIGTYTVRYDATDAAGNAATQVTRTVTVQAALGFDVEPTLATNNAGDYAIDGNTLTLTFTVNQALASTPEVTVTIAGRPAEVTPGAGNAYTATYTVVAADVADDTLVGYGIAVLTAADNPDNTLGPTADTSAIRIDVLAPIITLNGDAAITLTVGDAYNEQASVSDTVDGSVMLVVGGGPVDTSAASVYNLTYNAQDAAGNAATQVTRTVTVAAAPNTAPTIDPGNEAPEYAENTDAATPVAAYAATDAESNAVTWSHGGTDADLFEIDAASGALRFKTSPDYEALADDDANNDYQITITATDDGAPPMTDTLDVTVTVTDVDEDGAIGAITGNAQVGGELTAGTVTDPDSVTRDNLPGTVDVADITYQWRRSPSDSNDYTDIGGATGSTYALMPIDSGKTIQVIAGYTDTHAAQTVTSGPTATIAEADAPATPSIALAVDTGTGDDGITSNGLVDVAGLVEGATWKHTIKGETGDALLASSVTSFTLPEGVYAAGEVRVVQTVLGTDSPPAFNLGEITVDTTVPTANFGTIAAGVIGTAQDHEITFSEEVTGVDSTDFTATGATTVDNVAGAGGTYTITFTPGSETFTLTLAAGSVTDIAGNAAPTATATGTATVALAFSAGPDLTSSNSGDYAMEGDTLTLTFTVNLDLASDPSVTIAGQSLTATAPDSDNVYTAAYTVNAAQVMDMDGALAMYATAEMAADGNPGNTLAPTTEESAIRIDVTAPVITRTGDAAITLTVGTDYTDEGATATDTVDDNVSVTTGGDAVNTNTIGTYTVRYDATDAAGNAATQVTRTVTVEAAALSMDVTLETLAISQGALSPAFESGIYAYAVSVTNDVASVTVTPTVNDADNATVTVDGGPVDSGAESTAIDLSPGMATDILIEVTAEDGTATQIYRVIVTRADNTAPAIDPGNEAIMHAENTPVTTPVATYAATDADGADADITWSLTGDADESLFSIGATTGVLTFNAPPDYEMPTDDGGNRVYDITITATDDGAPPMTDTLDVTVTVGNVDEDGAIGAITGNAQVGGELTAGTVTDPDAVTAGNSAGTVDVADITYQWRRSPSDSNDYTDIGGATGSTYALTPIDSGKTIQVIAGYTDTHAAQTVTSGPTATIAEADAPATPSIALAVDTGTGDDGITSNGLVNVAGLVEGATWKHTIKSETSDALLASSVTSFTLPEGVYPAGEVRVVQTVLGTDSDPATFDRRITVDATAPTIALNGDPAITLTVGDGYTDQGAAATDNLDASVTTAAAQGVDAVDTDTAGEYTITYTARDAAGNAATQVTRTVTVQAALGFDVEPTLASSNSGDYAIDGDRLTLTFTVNQELASDPSVTIAGRAAAVTRTGNAYTAIYDVVAADVSASDGALASYDIGAMAAVGNSANTLDPEAVAESAIRIDVTAPSITLTGETAITLTVGDAYDDLGATATDAVDGNVSATTGGDAVNTNTIGTYTVRYDATDAAGNAATQVTRTVTVQAALGFDVEPTLATNNAGDYAIDGNTLTLTFTVNQALASTPEVTVTIAGRPAEVTPGAGNAYTATYTVVAADVADDTLVGYGIAVLTAADNPDNTLGPTADTSAIRIDVLAPIITLNGDAAITLTVGDAYNEQASVSDTVDGSVMLVVGGGPVDTSAASVYNLTYNAQDAAGNAATQVTRTVTVAAAPNTAPTIDPGNEAPEYAENTDAATPVAAYAATDAESNAVTWSHGGTDADLFEIDAASGALRFKTSPDYEALADDDANNDYQITITATDDGAPPMTDTLDVTVTVTDVDEDGAIGAITGNAQVGGELTAGTVTDPDSVTRDNLPGTVDVADITYQWRRSPSDSNDYTDIGGATGSTYALMPIDSGKTIQVIAGYTDTHAAQTVTSGPTATIAEADAPATPSIALAVDTGTGDDGITSNGLVDVAGLVEGATWKHTIKGETGDALLASSVTSFTLPEGVYAAGEVRVVQTVLGTDSPPAFNLGEITVDTTVPTANFGTIAAGVIGTAQDHEITFSEEVTGVDSTDFTATGATTVDNVAGAGGTYTITFTPGSETFTLTLAAGSVTDIAGNAAPTATATGTATVALAFSAGPDLTSSNSGDYAMEGDTLTLTFTVNLDLASDPSVTIAGQSLTATAPDSDNVYTAAYTVNAAQVMDMDGALAMYATAEMAADGNPGNTLAPTTAESAIRIDVTAPSITLTGGDAPILLTVGGTYTEQGATAMDNVDASVPTPIPSGAVDTTTPSDYTITYTATDRAGNVATRTRTVTVSEPAPSTDATLSTLTISQGTLNPTFASGTDAYTVSVGNGVASVTVTPTTTDDNATVTVNTAAVTSGQASEAIALTVGANNIITIEVTAEDSSAQTYIVTVTRAANTAPAITRTAGDETVSYDENGAGPVADYAATDADGADTDITWSLSGTDAGSFAIDADGALTFKTPPDFEAPADVAGSDSAVVASDNKYQITITATDNGTPPMTDTLDVTVTVTNVDEPGAISDITGDAQVGATLTAGAAITDEDGSIVFDGYQWQSAPAAAAAGSADWADISGETSETYTVAVDIDRIIRVVVTYTDGEGSGKQATSNPTEAVIAAPRGLTAVTLTDNNNNDVPLTMAFGPDVDVYTAIALRDATEVTIALSLIEGFVAAQDNLDGIYQFTGNPPSIRIDLVVSQTDGSASERYVFVILRTPPPPTIALDMDTGTNASDGITSNGLVNVMLAIGFDSSSDAWHYSTDGGDPGTVGTNPGTGTAASFTLNTDGDHQLRVRQTRQTSDGDAVSAVASLAVTLDTTAPTVDFRVDDVEPGVVDVLQNHNIAFSEAVTDLATDGISGSTGAAVALVSGSGSDYIISITPSGTSYTLILTANAVTDLAGNPNAEARVSVDGKVNRLPVANAGPNQLDAVTDMQVTLDGSGSTDDDSGNDLTYSWVHTSTNGNPPAIPVEITEDGAAEDDTDTPGAAFTPTAEGTYTFTLTVTDKFAARPASDTDEVEITVQDAPALDFAEGPALTTSNAGDYAIEGDTLELTFTVNQALASTSEVTVTIARQSATVESTGNVYTATYTVAETDAGVTDGELVGYDIGELVAADDNVAALDPPSTETAIQFAFRPPTAAFAPDPLEDLVAGEAASVTLTITDGTVGGVSETPLAGDFSATNATLGVISGASGVYQVAFTPTAAGTVVTITFNGNGTATDAAGNVIVEVSVSGTAAAATVEDTTAPVIIFNRFEHSGGLVVEVAGEDITYLNAGDTLTVFVQSDEELTAASLVGGVSFKLGDTTEAAQNLSTTTTANQYSAVYTVKATDNADAVALVIDGAADAEGNSVVNLEIPVDNVQIDTTAPTIALVGGPVTLDHSSNIEDYTDASVSGVDADAGELLATVITNSGDTVLTEVDTTAAGDYTYTYTATDRAGNDSDPVTRTVTVEAASPTLTAERQTDNSIRLAWSNIPTDYRYQFTLKESGVTSARIFELAPNANNFVIIHTTMAFFERLNAAEEIGINSRTSAATPVLGPITFTAVPPLNPTGTVEPTITATRLADNSISLEWSNLPTDNSYEVFIIKDDVSAYLQIIPRTSPYVWAPTDSGFEQVTNADRIAISGRADTGIFPIGGETVRISAPVPAPIQALAFAEDGGPALTSNGATVDGVTYAIDGNELILTFTVNQELADDPAVTVTIAGRDATVVKGAGNDYTATYTVVADDVTDNTLVGYNIAEMVAADNPANTLAAIDGSTEIRIDVTAPTVTDFGDIGGIANAERMTDLTFSEPVTGLAADDFDDGGEFRVSAVTPSSGFNTVYTITFTTGDATYDLILNANAVTDRAGNASARMTEAGTANYPPTADAGDDADADADMPVTLDGTGSDDGDGHTLTYAWEHTSTDGGAPDPAITLTEDGTAADDPATPTAVFTPTAAGAYTFTLTVADDFDPPASDSDTVVITVTEPADTTPPTVTLGTIDEGVIGTPQQYTITFSEPVSGLDVDDFGGSEDVTVNSVTPASGPSTTYTISITPIAIAFDLLLAADSVMDTATAPNTGPENAASASGTATVVLAFAAGGSPALATNNTDAQRAKEGDILTLAFTVNQALASAPVVTIAGRSITATKGSGNDYTATYTVATSEVTDGALVSYSTGTLTAAGPAGNTAEVNGESAIRIDLTAPTITLTGGDAPILLTVGGTYTEQGATATDNVDASVPTPTPSGAVDTNTPSDYTITYTATDRAGNVATRTRTVTVEARANTAPRITAGNAAPNYAENAGEAVETYAATATGSRTIAGYALGGPDATAFSITNAGVLTFKTPPNFESPTDAGTDNDYEITITATDDASETSDAVAVTVRVANAEDAGSVNAISGTAQVGETLTAGDTVTDEDGAIAITGHQWQRGNAVGEGNTDIDSADQPTYDVVVADLGATLRVVVSYTDGFGGNTDTATSESTEVVMPAPAPGDFELTAGEITATSITITWEAVEGANRYTLFRDNTSLANFGGPASSYTHTDNDLTPETPYTYRVDASHRETRRPFLLTPIGSANLVVSTQSIPSPPITGLVVDVLTTPGMTTLSWDAYEYLDGDGAMQTYNGAYVIESASNANEDPGTDPSLFVFADDETTAAGAATYTWDANITTKVYRVRIDDPTDDTGATKIYSTLLPGAQLFKATNRDSTEPANEVLTYDVDATGGTIDFQYIPPGGAANVPASHVAAPGVLTSLASTATANSGTVRVRSTDRLYRQHPTDQKRTTPYLCRLDGDINDGTIVREVIYTPPASAAGGTEDTFTVRVQKLFIQLRPETRKITPQGQAIDVNCYADGAPETKTITLQLLQAAPTAEAGDPQTVVAGMEVTLDGSRSSDTDGTIASYAWTHTMTDDAATTPETAITLTGGDTVAPTFTAPDAATTLVFSLTVTDDDGASSAADTVVITVTGADVTLPATPTIALATDTGADSDGVTNNGLVNVTGLVTGATWKHIINGTPSADFDSAATTTFTLLENVYASEDVQVVQTVNGVDSAAATFAMQITVDTTAPTVATFDIIDVQGTVGTSQTHPITFSEAVTGLEAADFTVSSLIAPPDGDIEVDSVTDSGDQTTYTITFTPAVPTVAFSLTLPINSVADIAGNPGPAEVATITGAAAAAASTDATLSTLTISDGALSPAFVSTTGAYTASVGNEVASVTVTPTTTDDSATVTVGGNTVVSGEVSEAIPLAPGAATDITIIVTAEDTTSTQTYTVVVTRAANTAPVIDTADAAVNYAENTPIATAVATYTATDAESDTITWSVGGGTDAALFAIDADGVLTFKASPNFEVPTDDDGGNDYEITITATDDGAPSAPSDALAVTVRVTNVDEAGAISDISGTAQVGEELTAGTVTDADSPADVDVGTITYQWQGSPSDSSDYTNIIGADQGAYTPDVDDVGRTIQVIATYTDGHGSGKEATSNPTEAVQAATPTIPTVVPPATPIVFAENDTATVHPFSATATGSRTIASFALGGAGADENLFDLTSGGVLTFSTPPDFEAPTDANTDNDYEITITATDDASETSDAVAVTVRVANAEDAGSVSAITGTAQVGETLTAGTVVTDQDSADTIAITGHQWQRGDAAGDNNTDIDGATGNTYEVVVADEGNTLRVVVSYTDGFGGNTDEATSASSAVVTPAPGDFVITAGEITATSIALTWEPVEGANRYSVHRDGMTVVENVTTTSYTVIGLAPETSYTFRVTARSVTGRPPNLQITDRGTSTLTVSTQSIPTPSITGLVVDVETAPGMTTLTWDAYMVGDGAGGMTAYTGTYTIESALTRQEPPGPGEEFDPTLFTFAGGETVANGATTHTWDANPVVKVYRISIDDPANPGTTLYSNLVEGAQLIRVTDNDGSIVPANPKFTYDVTATGATTLDFQYIPPGSDDKNTPASHVAAPGVLTSLASTTTADGGRLRVRSTDLPYRPSGRGFHCSSVGPRAGDIRGGSILREVTYTPPASVNEGDLTDTFDVSVQKVFIQFRAEARQGDALGQIVNCYADGAPETQPITLRLQGDEPTNQVPVAEAGDNQDVETGASVTLNGSGSDDTDGTIESYAWAHTQTDGATPAPAVNLADDDTASPTFTAPATAGVLTFELTVTDDGGATATDTVTITVSESMDTTAPVITLLGDSRFKVDQGATYTDPGATASDDRDGDISAGIVVGGDTVDTDMVGEYIVTYNVSDSVGNAARTVARIVRVVEPDTVAPVITLLGDSPLEVDQGATYTDPGATASDDRDGDISAGIVVGGDTVETDTAGEYTVTYDVSDAAGNAAEQVTRIVRVVLPPDTAVPVITLLGDSPLEVDQHTTYTDPGATASDDRDGDISARIVVGGDTVEIGTVGEYTVTYNVSDAAGNAAETVTRIVRVILPPDTVPPVIELLGDSPLEVDQHTTYTDPGATASDDRDGDISARIVVGGDTVEIGTVGEYTVTYNVSDAAGNAAEQVTRIVRVVLPPDTVPPVIELLGDSPLEVDQGATYTDPGATASDDRDGDISAGIVVGGDTVDADTAGEYTVTYDVSDAAGNAAETVTRIVRVVVVRDLDALNRAILPEVARDIADQNVSAIARRLEQARLPSRAAGSASLGGASSLAEIANSQGRSIADDRFDLKRLLGNSNFVLPLSATGDGEEVDDTQLTLWGAGDYRNLKGADGVRWDGDLLNLQLGLDAHLSERTILGVSVSRSQAELDYTDPSMATSGDYDLDMTSVYPYLGWTTGGLDLWATLGYGQGELEISEDGAQADIPSSDLSMLTLGLGANGVLIETGATTLLFKTEILSTELEVDASEGITALTQKAHRMRMTLEAIRGFSLSSGARLETSLEAGLRYDGGDGTTGTGAEIGGGLRYAGGERLMMEGKARALVGGKGDAEEWGLSGLIKFSPAANGRGLSFSLAPGYGATASGVERLWRQGLDEGLGGQGGNNYSPNLDIRLDYGMDVPGRPGLMTPYTEFSLGDRNTYRLGLQWRHSKWLDLKLVGEREEGGTTAEHGIYLEGEIVF